MNQKSKKVQLIFSDWMRGNMRFPTALHWRVFLFWPYFTFSSSSSNKISVNNSSQYTEQHVVTLTFIFWRLFQTVSMLSARSLVSSVSRAVNSQLVRHVSSSRPCLATFQVQDEEEFQKKVLGSEKPIIVDFSATWCGPCKLLSPR